MQTIISRAAALLFVASVAVFAASRPAQAETLGSCAGFIDSVPATITTQGTWCLRKDLSTSIASGAAITVAVNNVTIDCNDFKLGGLSAGPGTLAVGIYSERLNARVRNCSIRGFRRGVTMHGAGTAVVDSRLDQNTRQGIYVGADGFQILRNTIRDTGGTAGDAAGIEAWGSGFIEDNRIDGVVGLDDGVAYGILSYLGTGLIAGNAIIRVQSGPNASSSYGIGHFILDSQVVIRGNSIAFHPPTAKGEGISCQGAIARDNVVFGHGTGISASCINGGGNVSVP